MSHPLWSHFDIEFRSRTPPPPTVARRRSVYCAPAAGRLRTLICINRQITTAIVFDNLSKLGFTQHLMMDITASCGFLKEVRENGGMILN
ncbi:hypothetical protein ACLB1N_26030 [Escherichia coli]